MCRVLDWICELKSVPEAIMVDHGPEFTSSALDQWACKNNVTLDFIRPGKPIENAHIENFNGRLGDESLNENVFASLREAREKIEAWRNDYNQNRPHSGIKNLTPYEFAEITRLNMA